MIEIRLFATFREGRDKIYKMERNNMSTVTDVLAMLEIHPDDVAICLINGFHHPTDARITDGDTLSLFPPVGGG